MTARVSGLGTRFSLALVLSAARSLLAGNPSEGGGLEELVEFLGRSWHVSRHRPNPLNSAALRIVAFSFLLLSLRSQKASCHCVAGLLGQTRDVQVIFKHAPAASTTPANGLLAEQSLSESAASSGFQAAASSMTSSTSSSTPTMRWMRCGGRSSFAKAARCAI